MVLTCCIDRKFVCLTLQILGWLAYDHNRLECHSQCLDLLFWINLSGLGVAKQFLNVKSTTVWGQMLQCLNVFKYVAM
jgi:hypothetical protein